MKTLFAGLSITIAKLQRNLFVTLFTVRVSTAYHLDAEWISILLALPAVTFTISSAFIVPCAPKSLKKRHVMIFSLAMIAVGYLLHGPSKLLHLPVNLYISISGIVLITTFSPFLYTYIVPEMIESSLKDYPNDEAIISDYSSALFQTFYGVGGLTGPVLGEWMTQRVGFRSTCDMVAIALAAISVLYYLCTEFSRDGDNGKDKKSDKMDTKQASTTA